MKAIVSLFISAYQPGMASIECRYFKSQNFEEAYSEAPSYEDICWMISRARRSQPLGYCVMYLRYVGDHSGYAKTVTERMQRHIALHPNLKEALSTSTSTSTSTTSTSFIAYLQQHEDLFCHTLHQQLIEFHTSR